MASDKSLLLALPDPCLLKVLECCAQDGPQSLLNLAMPHNRLQQAAVSVLRDISVDVPNQQKMDSVLMYLGKYGEHVDSLAFLPSESDDPPAHGTRDDVVLRQLPPNLKLRSLQLCGYQPYQLKVQLQQGNGFDGVLAAGTANLKKLCLNRCNFFEENAEEYGLALSQLPAGLEHLNLRSFSSYLPSRVLRQLKHLTYLKLTVTASQRDRQEEGEGWARSSQKAALTCSPCKP
jgi:hypothetical protein